MKLNEFEAKLANVSDAKLRQMLSASRANGPDVAVKLILAEGQKRGMDDLEESALLAEMRAAGSATSAYAHEHAGYGGSDAPASPSAVAEGEPAPGGEGRSGDAQQAPPEWLNEETKSGIPVAVKVLLLVAVVGGILFLAWKFSH